MTNSVFVKPSPGSDVSLVPYDFRRGDLRYSARFEFKNGPNNLNIINKRTYLYVFFLSFQNIQKSENLVKLNTKLHFLAY